MFYVYSIINTITNKRYIGKTSCVQTRMNAHRNVAFNKNIRGYNTPLYKAFRKYAKLPNDVFNIFKIEFILEYETEDLAFENEIKLIDEYKTNILVHKDKALGYNATFGGEGITGHKHTEEIKNKFSELRKGEKHPNFGKSMSMEQKQKISTSKKGKSQGPLKQETKDKISISNRGKSRPHSQETKDKISISSLGEKNGNVKLSWEIVNKIRQEYKPKIFGLAKLAQKYGVSVGAIFDIIKYRSWKI